MCACVRLNLCVKGHIDGADGDTREDGMEDVPTKPLLKKYGWIEPALLVISNVDDAGHDSAGDLVVKLDMMLHKDVRCFCCATIPSLRRQRTRR